MKNNYNRVIGIQCYGTSGTTLMHSLLDNHSSIISLPFLHGRDLYTLWTDHIVGSGNNIEGATELHEYDEPMTIDVSIDTIIEKVKKFRPYFFDHTRGLEESLTRVGDNQDKILTVNEDEFFKHIRGFFKNNKINRKNFIISIYLSFNKCFGLNHDDNAYICIPIHDHSIKIVEKIMQDFKEVKILTMVRNPVKCIGSMLKHINYNQHKYCLFKSHLKCAISVLLLQKREHYEIKPFQLYGKTPYFTDTEFFESKYIKLETVHKEIKNQMKKISKWLKINFDEKLLESTFMGYKWHNRKESIQVSGANTKVTSQTYEKFLNKFDYFRIKFLSLNELIYFEYYKLKRYEFFFLFLMPFLILIPFKIDFDFKTIIYRFKAVFNIFSENKKLNISNWILFDTPNNTIFGPHLEEMPRYFPEKTKISLEIIYPIRIFNFTICIPLLIMKIIYNYINLRIIMFFLLYKAIFHKIYTKSFIKPM